MPSIRWFRLLLVIAVVLVALALRLRAIGLLPIDYDEDDYLRAAQQYATAIQAGDWAAFTQLNYRMEHPPLTKIVNGFALALLPPVPEIPDRPTTAPPAASLPQPHFAAARLAEMLLSVLGVLVLALWNPLAGLFLAINTWEIKYTSQVMLETLPVLTSAVAVMAYSKSGGRRNRWLAVSAIALGLTAASKYMYCVVALAILVHWFWAQRREDRSLYLRIGLWGILAIVVFFIADPYLWPDPVGRLGESVFYHFEYAQSEHVREAGYPMWQPLLYLTRSVHWHSGVFLFSLDLFVSIFALLGFRRFWQKHNVFALWFVIALGFLLLWSTKWPQYILMLLVPLALAAAEGFQASVAEPVLGQLVKLRSARKFSLRDLQWQDTRRAWPWLLPGTITLLLVTLFPLVFQTAMAATDLTTISLRDGINGGIWREAWRGVTGQVAPVQVSILPGEGIVVRAAREDRGELRYVPITESGLAVQEVHYAGLGLFLQLFTGTSAALVMFEIVWTVLSVGLQLAVGLLLAMMLDRPGVRLKDFWQVIFILPWAVPEFVGVLTWLHLIEPTNGWLSLALGAPIPWRDDPLMALAVLLLAALWLGFPFMMVAARAGLKMVPRDTYDAAAVDGAGGWDCFRFITWPLLLPLLGPAVLIRAIFAFNQFYLFYVLQPPWPLFTFSTLSFALFNSNVRGGGQYAVSAVINLFTVMVLVALLVWFSRRTRLVEGVTYA